MKSKTIFAIFCSLIITACNNTTEKDAVEPEHVHGKNIIELTPEQFNTVGIELGTITQKDLQNVVKASGYLDVPPQNKASVSTYLGAIVKSISVLEGNFVKKGQVLATLEHPDFIKLQEEYITAKNEMDLNEKEYLRQKELAQQNAGVGKIFEQAESNYNTSKAKFNSLQSQLKLLSVNTDEVLKGNIASSFSLVAPIDGFVGDISVNIGSYAEPTKTLFEIVDNSKIHCDLFIYEKDLFKVKVGQNINFILANLPEHQEEHHDEPIQGKIFGINKSFENDTKSLTVHAEIENEKHELIPGMYVNAIIDVGEQTSMCVPVDAVVKSDGKEYIFVVCEMHPKEDHNHADTEPKVVKEEEGDIYTFKMVEVVTGISDLGFIEIKPVDQISPDAKIVIKNPFFLLSKAQEGEGGGDE